MAILGNNLTADRVLRRAVGAIFLQFWGLLSTHQLSVMTCQQSSSLFWYARRALSPKIWGTLNFGLPPEWLRCIHKFLVMSFPALWPPFLVCPEGFKPPIPGDFAVGFPPELGGGGGQMQNVALPFEMCVHGSPRMGGTKGGKCSVLRAQSRCVYLVGFRG